jgi:hypothetical protein
LIVKLTVFLKKLVVSIVVLSLKVAFYILRNCSEIMEDGTQGYIFPNPVLT